MNRVQVVGANGGGVAYSKASVIPWKKRIDEGFYKQKGGAVFFDGLSQGMFGIKQTRRKKLTEKQRQKKLQEYRDYQKILHPPRKQKGGFSRVIARLERGRKRSQKGGGWFGDKKFFRKKQKGGGWFDGRKPAVIHSAATSYPQKGGGGKYGGFKGFFENPFHVREKLGVGNKGKKQKGGVLGLGKFEKWYGGKSKKQQGEIDAWAAKNL